MNGQLEEILDIGLNLKVLYQRGSLIVLLEGEYAQACFFGIINIELPLAFSLYHFDWKLPSRMKHEDWDMADHLAQHN